MWWVLVDGSGNKVGEQWYFPWGEERYTSGSLFTDRRFTGQRWDGTIGLYDYRARYYDPVLGRFVQPDTIVPDPGNPQSLSRYTYAGNNPLRYRDTTGHCLEVGLSPIPCEVVFQEGMELAQQAEALAVQYGPAAMAFLQANIDKLPALWDRLMQFARGAGDRAQGSLQGGNPAGPGGLDPNDFDRIAELFRQKLGHVQGSEQVLNDLGTGGTRAQGASWQARYAMEHLNPRDIVGFEQAGTTGRVDIVLRQGGRITFLEAKQINWYSLQQELVAGRKAESIVRQMLGHAEGQDVFSKVVIEATGTIPEWFIDLLQQEGIIVEVFGK